MTKNALPPADKLFVPDEAGMLALGARMAAVLPPGAIVFLGGDLGAGKTTLVRGVLRGMGHRGIARSPTFTLVEPYDLDGQRVFHFDLYRLGNADELEYLGARDYFDGESICLVEWPEKGEGGLPRPDLHIVIAYDPAGRWVSLGANTGRGRTMTDAILD